MGRKKTRRPHCADSGEIRPMSRCFPWDWYWAGRADRGTCRRPGGSSRAARGGVDGSGVVGSIWEVHMLHVLLKKWHCLMFSHLISYISHLISYLLEAVKSQKWRAGIPTVVTYIHRLITPPPPPSLPQAPLVIFQAYLILECHQTRYQIGNRGYISSPRQWRFSLLQTSHIRIYMHQSVVDIRHIFDYYLYMHEQFSLANIRYIGTYQFCSRKHGCSLSVAAGGDWLPTLD